MIPVVHFKGCVCCTQRHYVLSSTHTYQYVGSGPRYMICVTLFCVTRVRKHTDMRELHAKCVWFFAQRAKTCDKIWYLWPLPTSSYYYVCLCTYMDYVLVCTYTIICTYMIAYVSLRQYTNIVGLCSYTCQYVQICKYVCQWLCTRLCNTCIYVLIWRFFYIYV